MRSTIASLSDGSGLIKEYTILVLLRGLSYKIVVKESPMPAGTGRVRFATFCILAWALAFAAVQFVSRAFYASTAL